MTKKRQKNLRTHKKSVMNRNRIIPNQHLIGSSCDYVLTNQEELNVLSKYILDYPDIETGGQLFGYWTFDGKPVVLFVLGPGAKAGHYSAFFMQDIEYLKKRALILKQKYGLDHIGEWHSHHQLGLSYPSSHDAHNISTNMRKLGYSKFLLCIGTCTKTESSINAFMFYSEKSEYDNIPWLIKNIDSPFRRLIQINEGDFFIPPLAKVPNMTNLYLKGGSVKPQKIEYSKSYWLTLKHNAKVLKSIIDKLKDLHPSNEYIPTLDQVNEVHIEVYQKDSLLEDIHFPAAFPFEPPRISTPYGQIRVERTQWQYKGDILISFLSYYNNLIIS